MEYKSLKSQAEQKLKVADHLLSTTYSMVREPKLLISVVENLFHALELCIRASVLKEFKKHGTFEEDFELFRRKIVTKYGLDPKTVDFVNELKTIVDEHKKSHIEFSKKEKFVIADNDYNLKMLTEETVRKLLKKTKEVSEKILGIENE